MSRLLFPILLLPTVILTACASSNERSKSLQYVIRGEMPYVETRFQECYRLGYQKDSSLQGKMRIKFAVGADGRPTDYSVLKQELSGDDGVKRQLQSCVKDVLMASQFSAMDSLGEEYFDVQYPITFKPE